MKKIENISSNKLDVNKENIIPLLKSRQKSLPTKYLYDDKGSKLFEEICDTDEYYLTRTEKKILSNYSSDIIKSSSAQELFEFGSGSSKKTKYLILNALNRNSDLTYFSFDISSKALNMSFNELHKISKKLNIRLIKGDFNYDLDKLEETKKNRLYLFFRFDCI